MGDKGSSGLATVGAAVAVGVGIGGAAGDLAGVGDVVWEGRLTEEGALYFFNGATGEATAGAFIEGSEGVAGGVATAGVATAAETLGVSLVVAGGIIVASKIPGVLARQHAQDVAAATAYNAMQAQLDAAALAKRRARAAKRKETPPKPKKLPKITP